MSLHLDDLSVGQTFVSDTHELDAEQIMHFAREFDPQPFHTDEEAAKQTFFGGLAASGWHVAALTMRLMVEGGPHFADGMIGAGAEISWPRPTRPGDVLQVTCEITEIKPSRSKPDRGIVTLRSETRNQRDEVLQVLTSKAVVFRRKGS